MENRRIIGVRDLNKMDKVLEGGFTDIIVSPEVLPSHFREAQWLTHAQEDASTFKVADFRNDVKGETVRVWKAPEEVENLTSLRSSLKAFMKEVPDFSSTSNLCHEFIINSMDNRRVKTPRTQLKNGEYYNGESIHHAQTWGMGVRERREKKEELDQWDKNKAHITSFEQANVAPLYYGEQFTDFKGNNAPISPKWGGFYRIVTPEWSSPLPNPLGNRAITGKEIIVSSEIMKYLHQEEVDVTVLDAKLAPVHSCHALKNSAAQYRRLLELLEDNPWRYLVKKSYQALAGNIGSEVFSKGKPNKVFRPDWAQAIRDNSWTNILRAVKKVHEEDNRFLPVAINMDAIYYPKGLGVPPTLRVGQEIGSFKKVDD